MVEYADLEIGLHRRDARATYAVEFRLNNPDSEADIRFGLGQELQTSFELQELKNLVYDAEAYGRRLSQDPLWTTQPGSGI